MYHCVGSMICGSSVGGLLGVSIGSGKLFEKLMYVCMGPEGKTVASLSDSNDVRGRVEL